jgi:AraC family chemosensory pili system transcriptional regulator ChpD
MRIRRRTLAGIEISVMDLTGHVFARHSHDEFVVSANLVGRERVWLDGRSFEAEAGDVTVYNPGDVQAGGATAGPWRTAGMYVPPAVAARLLGRPEVRSPDVARRIAALAAAALSPGADPDEAEEGAALILADLHAAAGGPPARDPRPDDPAVRRAAARMLDDVAAGHPVSDLAAEAGTSPASLVRAFARATGLTPAAWLYQERLKRARIRIAAGDRLADVAADLGFADQAHLTRRFRAAYGVPPGEWREGGTAFKTGDG